MACVDDPNQSHPTLTSRERVSGSVIAHKALAKPKGALPISDSADAGRGLYPRVSEPNTVGGSRSGQCVKASPIKLGGPPAAKKF